MITEICGKIYDKLWSVEQSIVQDIKKLGDKLQLLLPVSFLIYGGCYLDNHYTRVFAVSFGIAMVVCSLIKALFNNPRPVNVDGNDNPDLDLDWSPGEGDSFPSGHTMAAMSGALWWFNINVYIGIIAILLATFVGFSRVISKAHWLRDVLTSSVISVIIYIIANTYYL